MMYFTFKINTLPTPVEFHSIEKIILKHECIKIYKKCIQMYPTTPKFIKMYPNKQKSTKCTKMYSGFLLLTSITKVQLYLSIHDCCILCNPQTTRNGIHAYKRDISFQNLYCLLLSITVVLIWYYIPYCYITSRAVCILM